MRTREASECDVGPTKKLVMLDYHSENELQTVIEGRREFYFRFVESYRMFKTKTNGKVKKRTVGKVT